MTYWLEAFERDPGDRLVFKIKLTREQFETLLGDNLKTYAGGGVYPVEFEFFVGETA